MKSLLSALFIFTCLSAQAQKTPANDLKTTVASLTSFRERLPVEKLYLQTDKPYYNSGDTLRFKSYLLNADFLTPSTRSGLLYVELDDATGGMVKRIMVPVVSGISWGDIALDEKEIPEGSYTLRAYTNWMRNFGEDYIFKKNIYISPVNGSSTLIKADFKLDSTAGKNKIQAKLRFTNLDKDAIGLKDMQLRVIGGKHTLYNYKAAIGLDGSVAMDFDLPDKTTLNNLTIQAQQTGKGADTATLTIPVILNRPEKTDLQFMPEGGNMVAGIPTKIGFKAISEDGKGITISGRIVNRKNQEVAQFQSTHKGMGSFELTPEAGESYTAVIDLPNKITKSYPLPIIKNSGTALKVAFKGNDSLEIKISAAPDLLNSNYYLIGQARGVVCYATVINLKNETIKKTVAQSLFPTGITRFTLLNQTNQPLNERLIYIDHDDNLKINVTTNRLNYTTRDSIALAVTVKDKEGKPVQGTFSVAVTDNDQVRIDSMGSTMLNDLLFTSDLKGTVEEPGWYFENNSPERITALDNLLLTQGWVGYDWKQVFDAENPLPEFPAEKEFTVKGKVTNVFNKPVEKSQVLLFSRKPEMVKDTVTGKDGEFIFKGLFPIDTAEFKLQARNKNDNSSNVGIEMMNEFKPPVFAATGSITPWYVNSDTVLLNNSNMKAAQLKAEADYRGEGHQLKEVKIIDQKVVKDSKNPHFLRDADIILDEHDMLKAGKMTLLQLLEQKVKGFNLGEVPLWFPWPTGAYRMGYKVSNHEIAHFYFDGIDLDQFNTWAYKDHIPGLPPPKGWMNLIYARERFITDYLNYFTAEDIKGIEVWWKGFDAIIEITTRAGKGPLLKSTPGTYLYKPLPFTLPKQFYSPKYTIKNSSVAIGTDLRSTIHWEPNLITDKDGKATLSFYSADKPADYTIIIEGTDLEGNIGYKRQKIKVGQAQQ